MSAITLLVTYTAKPGCRQDFVSQVVQQGLRDAILQEDGCVAYDYYCSTQDENQLLLVETWESEAQQQAHTRHDNMARLRQLKDTYLQDTKIHWLREEDHAL